jgi:transketolase
MPGLDVWRPADSLESAFAWVCAVERNDGPSALVFSRQNLPYLKEVTRSAEDIRRGGYIVLEGGAHPELILMATGSEVQLALKAHAELSAQGVDVRVVSMPCVEAFERQDAAWKEHVLPSELPRVAIEAGVGESWYRYVGREGAVISLERYGESAPAQELFNYFGFTVERIVKTVRDVLA